jgi:hypothetical protein
LSAKATSGAVPEPATSAAASASAADSGASSRAGPGGANPVTNRPHHARSSRDFFAGLIQDSQAPRAGFLVERERWLRSVQVEGREELLFEFEMLLRGLERYFNLHNLPLDQNEPVVIRDFLPELLDVRDALEQSIKIARRLLDPESDQKMIFRKYVESSLADDRARRELLEEELDQDTPQEALFVLRQSFEALRTVVDHLTQLQACRFSLFNEIGNLALREIVLNRYFRPFRPLEFRLEYDRIRSVPVLEALRKLPDEERRQFTLAFLGLFRVLHYLSYVADKDGDPPRRARVILALTRSEVSTLVKHLKLELGPRIADKTHRSATLAAGRALEKGHHRIVEEVLKSDDPRAPVDAAVAFTSLLREQLTTLARALDPELQVDGLWERLTSGATMAERLRKDLFVFAWLCRWAGEQLEGGEDKPFAKAHKALRSFIGYFHDVSYQLLRYGDFEPVDRFTALVLELDLEATGPAARQRLGEDCLQFAQVAETMFAAVSRRGELRGRPFNEAEARKFLDRLRPDARSGA